MNYFRRYPGDYAGSTPHLSLAEHGAYTLLLDAYYTREGPLPVAMDLNRICRAVTPAEKRAVLKVADEFFPVDGDVRRNGRCDQELALALPKIESARRNGQLGGRPSKTHRDSQDRTHDVTEQETEQETHGEPVKNHPPTTNPQPPSSSLQPRESLTPVGKGNGKPKIPRGWYESDEGVMTVGESLGLPPKRGESARAYKARIESAVAGLGL